MFSVKLIKNTCYNIEAKNRIDFNFPVIGTMVIIWKKRFKGEKMITLISGFIIL